MVNQYRIIDNSSYLGILTNLYILWGAIKNPTIQTPEIEITYTEIQTHEICATEKHTS